MPFVAATPEPWQGNRHPWAVRYGILAAETLEWLRGDPALTPGTAEWDAVGVHFAEAPPAAQKAPATETMAPAPQKATPPPRRKAKAPRPREDEDTAPPRPRRTRKAKAPQTSMAKAPGKAKAPSKATATRQRMAQARARKKQQKQLPTATEGYFKFKRGGSMRGCASTSMCGLLLPPFPGERAPAFLSAFQHVNSETFEVAPTPWVKLRRPPKHISKHLRK